MREEFTAKVKLAAFARSGGVCECGCGTRLTPGKIDYDHIIACGLGGSGSLDNCAVLMRGHHVQKTAGDMAKVAKAKRLELRHLGIRKPRSIRVWRKFNGDIVRAGRER